MNPELKSERTSAIKKSKLPFLFMTLLFSALGPLFGAAEGAKFIKIGVSGDFYALIFYPGAVSCGLNLQAGIGQFRLHSSYTSFYFFDYDPKSFSSISTSMLFKINRSLDYDFLLGPSITVQFQRREFQFFPILQMKFVKEAMWAKRWGFIAQFSLNWLFNNPFLEGIYRLSPVTGFHSGIFYRI